jgi:integrase
MAAPKMVKTKTPGIYKRGGSYVVVWEHRGKQHKSFHRTMAEAREAKGQRSSGKTRPTSRVKFGDYFAEWIEAYAGRTKRGFSETTRPEYRRAIVDHVLPRWATWKLSEIEPGDVRDLFNAMRRKGCSTSQIVKVKAPLSAMLATAVEDNLLASNPITNVRIPAAPSTGESDEVEPKAKALTRAELALLLGSIPEDWHLFFEFLAHTGLRISEAVGLRWKHLDLGGEQSRVMVREQFYKGQRKKLKSASGRRDVPLSSGMAKRLLALRTTSGGAGRPDLPVFASKAETELLPANVYRRVLAPAAIGLGFKVEIEDEEGKTHDRSTVSFHTFRHTCASLLFAAGRNVKQVQEWLGHADPRFTLSTYVHLIDDGVGDADFLDDEVGKGWARSHPKKTEDEEVGAAA